MSRRRARGRMRRRQPTSVLRTAGRARRPWRPSPGGVPGTASLSQPWRSARYLTGHLADGTVLAATDAVAASAARAHAGAARAMPRDSTRP
jgi:hypothetical protein